MLGIDLKPPYSIKVVTKAYPVGFIILQFYNVDDKRGITTSI